MRVLRLSPIYPGRSLPSPLSLCPPKAVVFNLFVSPPRVSGGGFWPTCHIPDLENIKICSFLSRPAEPKLFSPPGGFEPLNLCTRRRGRGLVCDAFSSEAPDKHVTGGGTGCSWDPGCRTGDQISRNRHLEQVETEWI